MFIPRMWSDEVERIGKQKCTPFGYALQLAGDLIGFVGLLMLVAIPIYLVSRGVVGSFHWRLLLILVVPFVVGVFGVFIVGFSWHLAARKQFKYDYERRESTWYEDGAKRSFTFKDWEARKKLAE